VFWESAKRYGGAPTDDISKAFGRLGAGVGRHGGAGNAGVGEKNDGILLIERLSNGSLQNHQFMTDYFRGSTILLSSTRGLKRNDEMSCTLSSSRAGQQESP
jgi:hypothetical protein